MIRGIETVVVRVSDYSDAADWYCRILGAKVVFAEPGEGLVVLAFAQGATLTIWQVRAGERVPNNGGGYPFPVLATRDAVAQRIDLAGRGIRTSGLSDLPGFKFFWLWDPDGNRLAVCELRTASPCERP